MQIAITHHQLQLKGGMETYLFNLIEGFNELNDEVTVFIYKKNKTLPTPQCKIKRKNLSWLPRKLRKYWFAMMLSKQNELNNQHLKISLMRSFNQDIIICGGTHLGFLNHTGKRSSLLDKCEVYFERKSYHTASLIVAHSKLLRDELISLYKISPEKILMSYPPINTSLYNQKLRQSRNILRNKFNFAKDKKIILFPSTGHKRKGFDLLVDAFKQLPEGYELIVAGSQPAKTFSKNIRYLGFVEDMVSLYTAADLTILPSYYEPFGLVVLESIACGTPVIISKYVGAKDLVSEQEGIVLQDISSEAIIDAIKNADARNFSIMPNIIEQHGLTISAHAKELKNLLAGKRSKND